MTDLDPHTLRSWSAITVCDATSVAACFSSPGPEYSLILWWGWDGPMSEAVIIRDLDEIKARGVRCVMIEAGYGMTEPYLSSGWFELVRLAVEHARRRDMRVYLVDEGKYPRCFILPQLMHGSDRAGWPRTNSLHWPNTSSAPLTCSRWGGRRPRLHSIIRSAACGWAMNVPMRALGTSHGSFWHASLTLSMNVHYRHCWISKMVRSRTSADNVTAQ